MRARHVMGIALLAAIGGCSSPEPQVTVNAPVEKTAAPPACSEVFVPGQTVDKTKLTAGCLSPSGTTVMVGFFDCTDGTVLWQVDATSGAPAGYAREGKPYKTVKGDGAADAGYKKAYAACHNDKPAAAGTPRPGRSAAPAEQPDQEESSVDIKVTTEPTNGGPVKAAPVSTTIEVKPKTTTPAKADAEPEPTAELTPVPGGEWAHSPRTTAPAEPGNG